MAISDADLWHQVHAQREDGVPAMFLVRDVEPRVDQPQIFVVQMPYAVTDASRLPDAAGYRRLDAFQEQWIEPACDALGWTFVAWKSEDGSFFLYLYGNGDPELLLEKLSPFDDSLGFFNDRDAEWAEYAALRELVEQAEAADEDADDEHGHDHDHGEHDHGEHDHGEHGHGEHGHGEHGHGEHGHGEHGHAHHDHSHQAGHHDHSNNHDHSQPAHEGAVKRPRPRAETIRETRGNPAYAGGLAMPAAESSSSWHTESVSDLDDAWEDDPAAEAESATVQTIIEAEFEAVSAPIARRRAATVAETPSAKQARGAKPAAPTKPRAKTAPDRPSSKAAAAKARPSSKAAAAKARPSSKAAAAKAKPPAAQAAAAKKPVAKATAAAKQLAAKAAASGKKLAAKAAASAKVAASAKQLAAKAAPARKPTANAGPAKQSAAKAAVAKQPAAKQPAAKVAPAKNAAAKAAAVRKPAKAAPAKKVAAKPAKRR